MPTLRNYPADCDSCMLRDVKLYEYAYESGNRVAHDIDAVLLAIGDVREILTGMIRRGSGPLAGVPGTSYRFEVNDGLACLWLGTATGPVRVAIVVAYREQVARVVERLKSIAKDLGVANELPADVVAPCIVTLTLPTMAILPPETAIQLDAVPRDLACVWLADELPPNGDA